MNLRNLLRITCCAVVLGTATAAAPDATVQALAVGTLVKSAFAAGGASVQVEAAVFPRDRVTMRVVEYPLGGPSGEMVRRAFRPGVIAATTGGFFTQANRPRGLLEIGGSVHEPVRPDLSGIVGSALDDAPVVVPTGAIPTAALKDAIQAGPFIVDPGGLPGIHSDDHQHARRSIVILSEDSIAVAYTSSCTLYELMTALLRSPRTFGVERVERALNLSGGPSAGFAVRLPGGDIEAVPELYRVRTVLTIQVRTPA